MYIAWYELTVQVQCGQVCVPGKPVPRQILPGPRPKVARAGYARGRGRGRVRANGAGARCRFATRWSDLARVQLVHVSGMRCAPDRHSPGTLLRQQWCASGGGIVWLTRTGTGLADRLTGRY